MSWDPQTGKAIYFAAPRRLAELYVLGGFDPDEKHVEGFLRLADWRFWVIPTAWLADKLGESSSLSVSKIKRLFGVEPVVFEDLRRAIEEAY